MACKILNYPGIYKKKNDKIFLKRYPHLGNYPPNGGMHYFIFVILLLLYYINIV